MPASSLIGSAGARIPDWFHEPGAYVLVDGQFGSTGKGLFAAYIAAEASKMPMVVTTNQGPNSGHTAKWGIYGGEYGIVTKQLPVFSAFAKLNDFDDQPLTYLNAGAIIDPKRLVEECNAWFDGAMPIIHPCAAVVNADNKEADADTVFKIASTGQGTGPALMAKLSRVDPRATVGHQSDMWDRIPHKRTWDSFWDWEHDTVFVETAQGFSLGINSPFYPHVTSRECTVMQAISDARIPAQVVRRVAMVVRTLPIRVGDVGPASSGGCYSDQHEISWEDVGVAPELTTVTKRVRRVFTWSREQFRAAVAANRPDVIFVNFMNYLEPHDRPLFVNDLVGDYMHILGKRPTLYFGFGPKVEDIKTRYW